MPNRELLRYLGRILTVIVIVVVFAFGLQVTEIDLKKPQESRRQEQLTNILRGLARPDLFAFETERLEIEASILTPCVPPGPPAASAPTGQPLVTLSTACAEPGQTITVSGSGFQSGDTVFLFFVPAAATPEEEVELKLVDDAIFVGRDGTFSTEAMLRRDRLSEDPQTIRAVVNRRSGWPAPSEALVETLDKIVETVFLALIATALGVILAVPFGFLAARNLMFQVDTQFANLMVTLVSFALGAYLVYTFSQFVFDQVGLDQALLAIQSSWSGLGILGNFLTIATDTIYLGLPPLLAVVGAWFFSSAFIRGTEALLARLPGLPARLISITLAGLAGAILFAGVVGLLNWFYQFGQIPDVLGAPAVVGFIVFGILGVVFSPDRRIPTGVYIYYIVRTIMNVFRSIEPLVMVVAFAVWVGIGPFAGVMALMLHTVVSLGKLYSEQVENIATGPIEAVTATGANGLQTIVYAVIPQIIPPYIAFTLYRWDINVRMSTIIGFGGGGGIGFLLAQNINLLRYRQASVNMLAIALVVATLDYISAKVRERMM